MKIINPIYDYAFKYLMQNERIAKKVLSVLLECEVVELSISQQEMIAVDESRGLKLYRLDFNAVILDENGIKHKVLIEIQKSKLPTNELRFRSYLGHNYAKKEVVVNHDGQEFQVAYPIISIYILGYNVVDIPYLAVSIDNKITNTVTKEAINVKTSFIDLLTHKTRIIQVRRLPEQRRTRLERFLLLFNQAWVTEERYILDLQEIPEEFKDVARYLEAPVQNEQFRNQLAGEEEIDEIFKAQEALLAQQEEALKLRKQQIIKAEQQVVEAEQQAAKAEQQAAKAEQQVVKAEQQAAKAEQQVVKAEQQVVKAEQQVVKAEQQAAKAEQQTAKAEERTVKAKQQVTEERKLREAAQLKAEQLAEKLKSLGINPDEL